MFDFTSFPLVLNIVLFSLAAAVVWFAGTRLAGYADVIAQRTGINYAIIGMLLLGGITSLPEIAVTVSASAIGDANLAIGSVFGSVALQVVVIAIADAMLRDRPLTYVTGSPTVLLQGTFCCLLLCLPIAGMAVGDVAMGPVGVWSTAVFVLCGGALWLIARYQNNETWRPLKANVAEETDDNPQMSLNRGLVLTACAALAIVAAGYVLAKGGEAIAEQTGLGSTLVGTVLVGFSTSLPEISTVIAAVRLKRYLMAFSDIFGTNIFDIALIPVADLTYAGPPIINELPSSAIITAVLAVAVTLIYMAGLIERKDRQFARLGPDSWAVIITYICGIGVLYLAGGSGA